METKDTNEKQTLMPDSDGPVAVEDAAAPDPVGGQELTAEDILSGGDDPYKRITVPQLAKGGAPGVLYLGPLSAGTVIDFASGDDDDDDSGKVYALIAEALVTKDGTRLFSVAEAQNLRKVNIGAFTHIQSEIMAHAGLTKDDDAAVEGLTIEQVQAAMVSAEVTKGKAAMVVGLLKLVSVKDKGGDDDPEGED